MPEITAYFTRLSVTNVALDEKSDTELSVQPMIDIVSATLWAVLRVTGFDPSSVKDWGNIFRLH